MMSAPGPGSPVVASTALEPVVGSQKVATSAVSPFFGYVGSGHGGIGGPGLPARTIWPPPAVGKHGLSVWPEQQSWLTPPLASIHSPALSVVTQAAPVHVAEQALPPQLSSRVSPQGFGPLSVEVLVMSGSVMVTVPARRAFGGQSDDSVYVVLPVVTIPSVRHACPARWPLSQVPGWPRALPEQRGQTWVDEVRNTSVSRWAAALTSPLWTSAVAAATLGVVKRLTMQTGRLAAKSGTGEPSVAPLTPSVALSSPAHDGLAVVSHPVRQRRRTVPKATGKLCE